MIWFDDEKLDARPPPLDSCISTIPIIRTAAKQIKITNNVYIFLLLFVFIIYY